MTTRKKPEQQRSRDAVRAVLEAGVALLYEAGTEAISIREIEQRSGVSVSTIYRFFEDKETLVYSVFQEGLRRKWVEHVGWGTTRIDSRAEIRRLLGVILEVEREVFLLDPEYYRAHAQVLRLSDDSDEENGKRRAAYASLFRHGRKTGVPVKFRNDLEAAALAQLGFQPLIRGIVANAPERSASESLLEELADLVWLYLSADRATDPAPAGSASS